MQKEWYKSKAKWGAVLFAAGGVITLAGSALQGQADWGSVLNMAIQASMGLGIWGVRDALK